MITRFKEPIESGTFAEECYDVNSIEELLDALLRDRPDHEELTRKHLTIRNWKMSIAQAIFWRYTNKKEVTK